MNKILIIDDDEQIRNLFKRELDSHGYSTITADDGDVGLMMFLSEKPDLTLVDIIMPRKEGIELIREIISESPQAKIIAISAGGRGKASEYLDYALRFGAKRILEKPVDLDQLAAVVDEVLNTNYDFIK
jgi:DNA-binding response OmpR family regulator